MALTWDISKIADWEHVCQEPAEADIPEHGIRAGDPVTGDLTMALVYLALSTGIGTITAENAAEVYARIALLEELHGVSLRVNGIDRPITVADVLAHVGLATNVSYRDETRAAWLKRIVGDKLDRSAAQFRERQEFAARRADAAAALATGAHA